LTTSLYCSECALNDFGDLDVDTEHVLDKKINDSFLVLLEISLDVVEISLLVVAVTCTLILDLLLQLQTTFEHLIFLDKKEKIRFILMNAHLLWQVLFGIQLLYQFYTVQGLSQLPP
jgi:hypothetical protein